MDWDAIGQHHEFIFQMYSENSSQAEIARTLDFPIHQIRRYMLNQGWTKEHVLTDREEFIEVMNLTGWCNSEAARYVGCGESTIRDRRRQFNLMGENRI